MHGYFDSTMYHEPYFAPRNWSARSVTSKPHGVLRHHQNVSYPFDEVQKSPVISAMVNGSSPLICSNLAGTD